MLLEREIAALHEAHKADTEAARAKVATVDDDEARAAIVRERAAGKSVRLRLRLRCVALRR